MSHRNGKPKKNASKRTKMRWNIRKNKIPKTIETLGDVIDGKKEDGFRSFNTSI